jgi:hypothetical protein
MPHILFTVDVSAGGKQAYDTAPNIDLTAGSNQFTPDYYLIRADTGNLAEACVTFDRSVDGPQIGLPTAAGMGQKWLKVATHSKKVWVREVGAGGATCKILIVACTNA